MFQKQHEITRFNLSYHAPKQQSYLIIVKNLIQDNTNILLNEINLLLDYS